jgi:hypothetical protein
MNSIPENTDTKNVFNVEKYLSETDNENVKNVIKLIIYNQELELKNILDLINLITKDNKITKSDIKSIITLVEKLIKLCNSKIELTYFELLLVVNILFKIIIDENNDALLEKINNIIQNLIKNEKILRKICCFCW